MNKREGTPHLEDKDNYVIRLNEAHWFFAREINVEGLMRIGRHFAVGSTFGYMFGGNGIYRGAEVAGNSFFKDH